MGRNDRKHLNDPSGKRVRNYESVMPSKENGCCKSEERRAERWVMVKPDGGWGWLVVFGVAVSSMTTISLISVFGLLFMRRLPALGLDTSGISLMASIQITVLNLSGLITGPMLKRFSPRQLVFTGGILVILGLYLTGYANSLFTFICTYSAMTGLGIGFLVPSTFVAIDSYFTSWRARAVGLSVAGTGLGKMLLPLLVRFLLDEYDFRGAVLILAGLSSHCLIGAALIQPVEWHMKRRMLSEEEKALKKEDGGPPAKKEEADELATRMTHRGLTQTVIYAYISFGMRSSRHFFWIYTLIGVFSAMDWDLLKDPSFVNLIASLALIYAGNVIFQMLLPFFLESVGYTRQNIAVCMSVLSGADIIARLIIPTATDVLRLKTKTVLFLGAGTCTALRISVVWYNKTVGGLLHPTLAILALCGFVQAGIICNFHLCVSDESPPEKLPSALGLFMVFKGLSVLIFGPSIGFIRDYTGSYSISLYTLNVFFVGLPFLVWLFHFISLKRRRR